ncbi:oligopeptide/dipeptide ABC transporter ATP-binding protein [Rhizobium sp. CB3090]|uniref:oligopeptide/dipeptide ABC transporter ATP-binding protein n=1 Tax=Rhizobium sp. CB3090 TaxID=3039156 RepID=UPI0032C229B8
MYLGSIVEIGETDALYGAPRHPYTRALLSAVPQPHDRGKRERILLDAEIPSPLNPPRGCKFSTRCPCAKPLCHEVRPPLTGEAGGRSVTCHFPFA